VPPSAGHPDGRILSTGGYHNAAAPAALHQLAVCYADLCQLAERHVERLVFRTATTTTDVEEVARLLLMVAVGYAEDARAAAQPVVLPRGGPGQNDVVSPAFLAWPRACHAADALCAVLAVLATAARWRLGDRDVRSTLCWLMEASREPADAVSKGGAFGREVGVLADAFRARAVAVGERAGPTA
jgi:histidine ammonia-lyase